MLIEHFQHRYLLGVESMDTIHEEFVDRVNELEAASGTLFAVRFAELLAHTRLHFDYEQQLMRNFAFPAITEHTDEHQRVLGELTRFARQVETGRTQFARAYVREALPAWFHLHATTMDSALAAHLKANRCLGVEVAVPSVSVSEQT